MQSPIDSEQERELSYFMRKFCDPKSGLFDAEFRDQLESLCPQRNQSSNKKQALLALGYRPSPSHPLYHSMIRYTNKSQMSYDSEFTKEYDALYPRQSKSECQKLELLNLGYRVTLKNDPTRYRWLMAYTGPAQKSYDREFTELYNQTYPHPAGPKEKKQELLNLGHRVTPGHPLYQVFGTYYRTDPGFRKLYDERYPPKASLENKKQQILDLGVRINRDHPTLGTSYRALTSPSHPSYDPEFTKLYNETYPPDRNSALKKTELLNLGRRVTKKDKLYVAFGSYTSPSNNSYDSEFTKLYNETYPRV